MEKEHTQTIPEVRDVAIDHILGKLYQEYKTTEQKTIVIRSLKDYFKVHTVLQLKDVLQKVIKELDELMIK